MTAIVKRTESSEIWTIQVLNGPSALSNAPPQRLTMKVVRRNMTSSKTSLMSSSKNIKAYKVQSTTNLYQQSNQVWRTGAVTPDQVERVRRNRGSLWRHQWFRHHWRLCIWLTMKLKSENKNLFNSAAKFDHAYHILHSRAAAWNRFSNMKLQEQKYIRFGRSYHTKPEVIRSKLVARSHPKPSISVQKSRVRHEIAIIKTILFVRAVLN